MRKSHALIEYIMEDEDFKDIILENEELLEEGVETLADFADVIKNFVIENISDFYDEDSDVMFENIATYSEIATSMMARVLADAISDEMMY
ncbi:MAG: hypothetical protein QXD03_04800 [Candidatus Anstonellales archaeon]